MIKHDSGKLKWSLLPLKLLEPVVRVLMFGVIKYSKDGWKTVPSAEERYYDALMRHITDYQAGIDIDHESGEPTLACICCNAIFLLHFYIENNK